MKHFTKFPKMLQPAFLCAFCFLVSLSTTVWAQGISWVSPQTARRSVTEFILRGDLIPAGVEEDGAKVTYPCRARHNNRLIPGKLIVHMGEMVQCAVVEFRVETKYSTFEVLFTPPGWTSWIVPKDPRKLTESVIVGGTHYHNGPAEVCRAKHGNDVIPGKYYAGFGTCYYGKDGIEYEVRQNFELLVSNMYGLTKHQ